MRWRSGSVPSVARYQCGSRGRARRRRRAVGLLRGVAPEAGEIGHDGHEANQVPPSRARPARRRPQGRAGQVLGRVHLAALEKRVAQLDGEEGAQPTPAPAVAAKEPRGTGSSSKARARTSTSVPTSEGATRRTTCRSRRANEADASSPKSWSSPSMRVITQPPAPDRFADHRTGARARTRAMGAIGSVRVCVLHSTVSVDRRVGRVRGQQREIAALAPHDVVPQPVGLRAEHVGCQRVDHEPGALGQLGLELIRRPPEYPQKSRAPRRSTGWCSGGTDRSTVPTDETTARHDAAEAASGIAARARPITASGETGPPRNTTAGGASRAWSFHGWRISPTGTCVGRLSTTPSAPSSPWSSTRTTARSKFGSPSFVDATRRRPVTPPPGGLDSKEGPGTTRSWPAAAR